MDKIFYNKEFFAGEGILFTKIVPDKNCYNYWWITYEEEIPPKQPPEKIDWGLAFLDTWFKDEKGIWRSDVEDDYVADLEFRKILVNNVITFDRKFKLEKLLS